MKNLNAKNCLLILLSLVLLGISACKKGDNNSSGLPTVTTDAVMAIAETTATVGGNVTEAGGSAVTARGIAINTMPNPTVAATGIAVGA
ncbi:MAG: hypothetical protein ABI378_07875, partial [Chitinophagaceae bacterium]